MLTTDSMIVLKRDKHLWSPQGGCITVPRNTVLKVLDVTKEYGITQVKVKYKGNEFFINL